MRRTYLPAKDASIYEEYHWRNTGIDEILEVGKSSHGTYSVRSLLQYDIPTISSSMAAGTIPISSSFDLNLYIARSDDLRVDQQIELYFVSRSWIEGTGYFYQNVNVPYTSSRSPSGGYFENDGVNWKYRQSGSLWSITGSEYYTSSVVSESIENPVVDMTIDVTSMIRSWISGTISNNGFLIKFPTTDETDVSNVGNIKFFSRQTHTIYAPTLVAKWDDQVFITGSISGSTIYDCTVTPKNIRPKYRKNEKVRIDLSVRNRYPIKTFDTVYTAYAGNQRLSSASYFSIVDIQSNVVLVPFDDNSKISCDGSGSYFTFYTEGMYSGRYYKVLIKTEDADYTEIFDLGHHFTIEQT